jgi:uncharacterized protein YcgL (UPF0745 family)
MECFVYKCRPSQFLVVKTKDDFSSVPEEILARFKEKTFLKKIYVSPKVPLVGADPKEIISNLNQKGYHFQMKEIG